MDKNPKVSVSIVSYNQEKYIEDCIMSTINQKTDFDFEIVVGDDYSTDQTREILKKLENRYPDKIRLLLHDSNKGACKNLELTIKVCKGEYIAHMDGDDLMLPNKLQKQVDFLDSNRNYAIIHHDMKIINEKSEELEIETYKYRKPAIGDINSILMTHNGLVHSSKMFRRSVISEDSFSVLYEESPIGDFIFHLHNAQYGKVGFLNEKLGKYRIHQYSTMKAIKREKILYWQERLIKESIRLKNIKQRSINTALSYIYAEQAKFYLDLKDRKKAKEFFFKSLKKINLFNKPLMILYLSWILQFFKLRG